MSISAYSKIIVFELHHLHSNMHDNGTSIIPQQVIKTVCLMSVQKLVPFHWRRARSAIRRGETGKIAVFFAYYMCCILPCVVLLKRGVIFLSLYKGFDMGDFHWRFLETRCGCYSTQYHNAIFTYIVVVSQHKRPDTASQRNGIQEIRRKNIYNHLQKTCIFQIGISISLCSYCV